MKYNFLCNKYIQCMFHITKPSYWTFILHIIYIHMLFFGCNPCAILSDRLWSFEFWDIDWDRFGSKKRFFFFVIWNHKVQIWKFLPHENYWDWELRVHWRENLHHLWERAVRIVIPSPHICHGVKNCSVPYVQNIANFRNSITPWTWTASKSDQKSGILGESMENWW